MYNCIVDEEIALLFAHDPLRVNDVFVTLLMPPLSNGMSVRTCPLSCRWIYEGSSREYKKKKINEYNKFF